ncbi:hypothetical protein [Bacillus mycoides]|uniref:hypothetical protein n=1 Tax=Bacillus mycoides TaxID=1405 RepID=UPI001F1DE49A|nr:hypothetical protein [Bacillus mycoides]
MNKKQENTNQSIFTLNSVTFQLQEPHNFDWLKALGNVFCVFDQQDSGNICFGVEKDNKKQFVKYAGAKPLDFSGNPQDAILRLSQAIPLYTALAYPHLIKLMNHFSTANGYAAVFLKTSPLFMWLNHRVLVVDYKGSPYHFKKIVR